jgi:DNA-binding MarR family transcriptional regulator
VTLTLEEAFDMERDPTVPESDLTLAGKIRRRLFRGEMVDALIVRNEIGGNNSILSVVILNMKTLGFEFANSTRREGRLTYTEYRLADPTYQPSPAAFEANKAGHRASSRARRERAKAAGTPPPSQRWVTAGEGARIAGLDDPDQIGKAWRAGRIVHRKPHPRSPRAYLYDRAEIEALWPRAGEAGVTPAEAVEVEVEPEAIPPASEALIHFLAEHGGVIADAQGRASTPIRDHFEHLGYTRGSAAWATTGAEKAGLVEREVNGKRCYRIALTAEGRKWVRAHPEPVPVDASPAIAADVALPPMAIAAGKSGTVSNGAVDLPTLPGLGGSVTVYALVQNTDGSITMGLRNGAASWQVDLIGATEQEP